jgi:hypothetical protein
VGFIEMMTDVIKATLSIPLPFFEPAGVQRTNIPFFEKQKKTKKKKQKKKKWVMNLM